LTADTIAQNTVSVKTEQPTTATSDSNIVTKYIEISSIPIIKRQKAFSDVPNELKANLYKFHLAYQFVKTSKLNQSQKDLILESISGLASDDYDLTKNRTNAKTKNDAIEIRAETLFSTREVFEVFGNLGGDKSDLEILNKYQTVISFNKAERDNFYKNSSSEDKKMMWKVKLAVSLATQDFDKSKQDFVLEGISLLGNELLYSSVPDSKIQIVLDEFQKKALLLFPKEQVYKMFVSLFGNPPVCSVDQKDLVLPTITQDYNCNCTSSFWCSEYVQSKTACKRGCTATTSGCGILGGSACSGACKSTIFPD
jgi:hypothetical protein